jgi:hypothetical protein
LEPKQQQQPVKKLNRFISEVSNLLSSIGINNKSNETSNGGVAVGSHSTTRRCQDKKQTPSSQIDESYSNNSLLKSLKASANSKLNSNKLINAKSLDINQSKLSINNNNNNNSDKKVTNNNSNNNNNETKSSSHHSLIRFHKTYPFRFKSLSSQSSMEGQTATTSVVVSKSPPQQPSKSNHFFKKLKKKKNEINDDCSTNLQTTESLIDPSSTRTAPIPFTSTRYYQSPLIPRRNDYEPMYPRYTATNNKTKNINILQHVIDDNIILSSSSPSTSSPPSFNYSSPSQNVNTNNNSFKHDNIHPICESSFDNNNIKNDEIIEFNNQNKRSVIITKRPDTLDLKKRTVRSKGEKLTNNNQFVIRKIEANCEDFGSIEEAGDHNNCDDDFDVLFNTEIELPEDNVHNNNNT